MYRAGHLGVSLLVYAPVGVALVVAGRADLAILGEFCMLSLATLPDTDHRLPFVSHRGPTHTVGFALLVGAALSTLGWAVGGQPAAASTSELAVFGFAIGTLSVFAHLLGDVITPMGIAPFWPVWNRRFTLGLTRADNVIANYGLLGLGVFVTAGLVVVARPLIL
ncbi:metal-dependent hydrolase [Halorientalis brevis]|uniref:Metal-dependent hydrolase n=1 Tax=Halorientalis brevis TaxID=1126241 RepID=A0ABD6CBC6_9EURY